MINQSYLAPEYRRHWGLNWMKTKKSMFWGKIVEMVLTCDLLFALLGTSPGVPCPNRLAVVECTALAHCLAFSCVFLCLSLFALISVNFFVFFVCECCRFLHVHVAAVSVSCTFYYLLNHSLSENKCCSFQGEYVYCCASHSLHKIILVVVFLMHNLFYIIKDIFED